MSRGGLRIVHVVGARPNFVKIAPLLAACRRAGSIEPVLVHTGQHYDDALSERFFRELAIPEPDVNLGVGSGSHAEQTAAVMTAFEREVLRRRPDAVLVVGDVNGAVAAGLVAAKLGIPLVHVEAGLRSGDRTMPEEINRIVIDAVSDLLFCTEQAAVDNLLREGVDAGRVFLAGNLMIDTLLRHRGRAGASRILESLALTARRYAVLTLHRPSNVDDVGVLAGLLEAVDAIQRDLPVVLPLHPRCRAALARFGLEGRAAAMPGLRMIAPLGYLDFVKLMSDAEVVLTDSGGIQEETTVLQVPCVTLRENTERPVTVEAGTNRLAGRRPDRVVAAVREARGRRRPGRPPREWDGRSAGRIVSVLTERLQVRDCRTAAGASPGKPSATPA